ncbi:ABC transporter ATP-binding protein [Carboxylicivirga mesophila]|uniref:ABC transporter ATP-binding protein n=1 Tax=Carboxylicivirga mesophila TaxID=1166478 RepID=A0ABS5K9V4_9BACT|nr:ABC transporter ATP-binding protein [Carboxylicivirga mesophila]MBS2211143.1 ABC transporter ATP-binding protein [Carboxylicivirga mesophila]
MKRVNKLSINHLLESLRIVYRSSPKWTLINAIITIVRGCIPLLLLYVVKELIDVVTNHINTINNNPQHLYYIIGATALFFLLNAISGSVSSLVRERQSHFVNDYVQNIIHKKTINIDYKYFEDANYQDTFYRALNDANFRPARVFYGILQLAQNSLTLLLILIILSNIHWAMIPILIISGAPIFYFRIAHTRKIYQYRKQHTEDERRVHYFNRLLTAKDFAKELRVFNLGETFKREYEYFKHDLRDKQWTLSKSKTLYEVTVQILATIILLLIIGYVVQQTVEGQISSGSMAMYFLALQRAYAVLQGLLSSLSSLYEDNLFLQNFIEFNNISIEKSIANQLFPNPIKNTIEIENVSFKYPNTNKWVLRNINLTIPKGKTVALVGRNGCGKTSLVKLLAGLHQPNEGQITVDNINWYHISSSEISKNISVIFQDFMLYNVSATNNIRFGNMRRKDENGIIQEAAQKAGIHELFSNLPEGFDTTLGTLFKGSQMLSRGEWQRTALARSFYNTDAQIIILDEPTSSLDAFTEAKLIAHFKEITKNKTAIIVSHRLSTIKLADIVVVMENSGIAEVGAPDELLKQRGVYFSMLESLK